MKEHFKTMGELLPFFNNKPFLFKESFCRIVGTEIRDEKDVLYIMNDFCLLMWKTVDNGKIIRSEDIYLIRGNSVLVERDRDRHHWPPSSVGGIRIILLSRSFHFAWHCLNKNLSEERDIDLFWRMVINDEALDSMFIINMIIDQIREGVYIKGH